MRIIERSLFIFQLQEVIFFRGMRFVGYRVYELFLFDIISYLQEEGEKVIKNKVVIDLSIL